MAGGGAEGFTGKRTKLLSSDAQFRRGTRHKNLEKSSSHI